MALVVLAACSVESDPLAPELYGRWVTTDDRYAGRYFEVIREGERRELVYGQGNGATHAGVVESISSESSINGGERFQITYVDTDGIESYVTLLLSADRTSFVFESTSRVRWTREEKEI